MRRTREKRRRSGRKKEEDEEVAVAEGKGANLKRPDQPRYGEKARGRFRIPSPSAANKSSLRRCFFGRYLMRII